MFENLKAMDDFVAGLNKKFPDFTFTLEMLRRYHRVVVQHTKYSDSATAQRSVYCFIEGDTSILKAAGWTKPARGARAHLLSDGVDNTLALTDPYGSWLYKR